MGALLDFLMDSSQKRNTFGIVEGQFFRTTTTLNEEEIFKVLKQVYADLNESELSVKEVKYCQISKEYFLKISRGAGNLQYLMIVG